MELEVLEVLTDETNYGIVRMPNRSFPGCLIQGDSLSILQNKSQRAWEMAQSTDNQELIDEIADLNESLLERLQHYEQVILAHGYKIPYGRPRT